MGLSLCGWHVQLKIKYWKRQVKPEVVSISEFLDVSL